MADWKQITARIRRARTSKDPAAQLANLYEKTQDAMVAFELARHFETAGQNSDAGKWYSTAATKFRRADWKTKATEAATRLGYEGTGGDGTSADGPASLAGETTLEVPAFALTMPEPGLPFEQNAEVFESIVAVSSEVQSATNGEHSAAPASASATEGKSRRRGRRGGRNRRKSSRSGATGAESAAQPAAPVGHERGDSQRASGRSGHAPAGRRAPETRGEEAPALSMRRPVPPLPVDTTADFSAPSVKGRYGDPGLSSRLSLLENQFRRLLTCEPAKLDETVMAPVGPGVLLLSDSDLTSYYYVEACQTLRIAVGNLLRGGSSRRGADSIKPQLAEHLGIPETRVSKYLADHCVVRWLQLDEGASHFAHFVVAVLRPTLNE
jgi:hypothetical protein